jgi:hypothetical protein
MTSRIPPRLRAPLRMLAGGAVITAVVTAAYGWGALLYLGPFTVVAAAGYYFLAGRDTDLAAMLRAESDERQDYRRLKIQALVGRVAAGSAAVAYVAAVVAKATLWPFAIFLAIPTIALVVGFVIYRERPEGRDASRAGS